MSPNDMIAEAITRERQRAGISLSALAGAAGLAKSTLSQLEAGKGNPSIETLWAIATALDIPFSFLFEGQQPELQLVRANAHNNLSSENAPFEALLLAKCPPNIRRDIFRVTLQAPTARDAEAHPRGTVEHALVCEGRVRLGPIDALQDMGPGDYYRYPGDGPHSYAALSERAMLLLVMEGPG